MFKMQKLPNMHPYAALLKLKPFNSFLFSHVKLQSASDLQLLPDVTCNRKHY